MDTKVNINTIAKTAKVSTTTVSNFINGTEVFPLSRDTRGRVKAAMRQLNYRPHIGGILMRRNQSRRGRVGFVMGEDCSSPVLYTSGIPLVQRFLRELEADEADVEELRAAHAELGEKLAAVTKRFDAWKRAQRPEEEDR